MTYQRWYEINTRNIIHVIDFDVRPDPFFATRFNARLEYVSVVEVLHRFGAQIDAQLFQLTRLQEVVRATFNTRITHIGPTLASSKPNMSNIPMKPSVACLTAELSTFIDLLDLAPFEPYQV